MEPIKAFNNVVIGQFVLTRIPIRVYVNNRYLKITSTDDVQDPLIGFGMDENGDMIQFSYPEVEFLSVQGNKVDIETYNKGMAAAFSKGGDDCNNSIASDIVEDEKGVKRGRPAGLRLDLNSASSREHSSGPPGLTDDVRNQTFSCFLVLG